MLRWLKSKLRSWLLDGEEQQQQPISLALDCWIGGKSVRCSVRRAVGLCLVVSPDGLQERVIGSGGAVDPALFWRIWRAMPQGQIRWEDGSEFEPPTF